MLSRVPTMLSIHQDEEMVSPTSILRTFSAKGAALPVFRFAVKDAAAQRLRTFGDLAQAPLGVEEESPAGAGGDSSSDGADEARSLLDTVLLGGWEERFERGLFRYDVTACPTRTLAGPLGFVAQLNEGRATKKRPTEFAVDAVCVPFDPAKFNFTRADEAEVLFQFEPCAVSDRSCRLGYSERPGAVRSSPHLLLINVSPIEYGHVLLVPHALSALPQQVAPDTLLLALHLARQADNPYFRVGFNSLGAYATVNHLHFQAYYLQAPFPLERAPCAPLPTAAGGTRRRWRGVGAQRTVRFPVRCVVFEVSNSLQQLAAALGEASLALQARNVPFNILMVDRGERAFLIPQRFAARCAAGAVPEALLETGVNPAVFEIAGHLLYKRACDYEAATQESAWALLEQASLEESDFLALVADILPE